MLNQPTLRQAAVTLSAGLLILTACRDREPTAPQVLRPTPAALSDNRPFYYYHGTPQYLDIDSTGFVFASPLPDPTSAAGDALSGLAISQVVRMPQLPDHWIVRLSASATPDAYAAALTRLRADARFGFVSSLYRGSQYHSALTLLSRLMVRFKTGVRRSSVDSLVSALGMQVLREPKPDSGIFYFVFSYPKARDPLEIAAIVDRLPFVDWADPDKVADRHLDSPGSSEPYFGYQWYLQNSAIRYGVRVDDNVEPAWNITTGSNSRLVAVFDDGIDGQQTDYLCANTSYWSADAFPGHGNEGAYNPYPTDKHGTAVSGIINGCFNSVGIAGIAPGVQLASLRIFRNGQYAGDQEVADQINFAWRTVEADVLSNSWGGNGENPSQAIDDAIHNAVTLGRGGKGAVVVFSAGAGSNRDLYPPYVAPLLWPATLADVIAVGAIDSGGSLARYTPGGPQLALVAPSTHSEAGGCNLIENFLTTDRPGNSCNNGPNGDPHYTHSFGGTSAAAPQVAAAAALMLSVNPSLTQPQVRAALLNTADHAWGGGASTDYGAGKLNIGNAVLSIVPPPPPPPSVSVTIYGPNRVPARRSCTWTAAASGGTQPYAYSWTVNGNPAGDGSDTLVITTPSSAFTIHVVASDANNLQAQASLNVSIGGPSCQS